MAGDSRVHAHLVKAGDRLAAARELLATAHWEDAVSRAYYAAFHGATAALLALGLEPKTHGGLRALFGLHIVQPGLADRRFGRILEDLYDHRRRSDYEVTSYVSSQDADAAVRQAAEFVGACRRIVAERGDGGKGSGTA